MPTYKGTFTNIAGVFPVEIFNDFNYFKFQINRFKFTDFSLDAFVLLNPEDFSRQEMQDFDIVIKKDGYGNNDVVLKNYQLMLKIPQTIIDMVSKEEIEVILDFQLETKEKYKQAIIGIKIDDQYYEAKNDFMELILNDLQNQFKGKYRFKNCYGCLYGDYSAFGQEFIGAISCFKNQKENYLNVQDKREYIGLVLDSQQQEIFCCNEYEIRERSVGYRGTVL